MQTEAKYVRRAVGNTVPIHVIGIGARSLPPIAEARSAGYIILTGFAGALDPHLKVGDVVLDAGVDFCPNFAGKRGKIHCSTALIGTPAAKAELFSTSRCCCVDMESDAVRNLAAEAGVPFIGLRAISDTADEALDPAVLRMVDQYGKVKPLAAFAALSRRPAMLGKLMRLGRSSRIAGENLSRALQELLSQSPSTF
jgi:hypothetical protein